jgi:metal-dependent amidase/aminoacylase/carboxypeptidase family protein
MVRAANLEQLAEVRDKVTRCFEAGALATGATLELTGDENPYSEMRHDHELSGLYQRNAEALGRSFPDRSDRGAGSTDMGNISLALPSIHPPSASTPCRRSTTSRVHRQVRHPGRRPGVFDGRVAMAWTAIDAATDTSLRERLLAGPGAADLTGAASAGGAGQTWQAAPK